MPANGSPAIQQLDTGSEISSQLQFMQTLIVEGKRKVVCPMTTLLNQRRRVTPIFDSRSSHLPRYVSCVMIAFRRTRHIEKLGVAASAPDQALFHHVWLLRLLQLQAQTGARTASKERYTYEKTLHNASVSGLVSRRPR